MTDNRRAVRVVPRRAITVAVADGGMGHETGLTRAYGVVANISETGACLFEHDMRRQSAGVWSKVEAHRHQSAFLLSLHAIAGRIHSGSAWYRNPCFFPVSILTS